MIVNIQIDDTTHQIDIGDVSSMSKDEKTTALHTAMTDAGLDPNNFYLILGEAE